MPIFRGVAVEEIIDSLKRTERFLRNLDIGPWATDELDRWTLDRPYEQLRNAPNTENIAAVFKYVDSFEVFRSSLEILKFHATVDKDGEALKCYQDLWRWGAFVSDSKKKPAASPALDERRLYLDLQYAEMIVAQGDEIPAKAQAAIDREIERMGSMSAEDDHTDPAVLAQDIQDVLRSIRQGDKQAAIDAIEKNSDWGKMLLGNMLYAASGFKEMPAPQGPSGPFRRYGALLRMTDRFETGRTAAKIGDDIKNILAPYIAAGDVVVLPGLSQVTNDPRSVGAVFLSTTPAAVLRVAEELPEQTIVNFRGERITALKPSSLSHKPRKFDL